MFNVFGQVQGDEVRSGRGTTTSEVLMHNAFQVKAGADAIVQLIFAISATTLSIAETAGRMVDKPIDRYRLRI